MTSSLSRRGSSRLLNVVALLGFGTSLLAHDPGLSASILRMKSSSVAITMEFNNADFARMVPAADLDRDGRIQLAEISAGRSVIESWFERGGVLRLDGLVVTATDRVVDLGEDGDVVCRANYAVAAAAELDWRVPALDEVGRGHRHYSAVTMGAEVLAEALLFGRERRVTADLRTAKPRVDRMDQAARFVHLGVEHILIGYDHILFLLGLLLVCSSWRHIVVTISMFTVAHSVTLVAASFGVVRLPGLLVEATIAASIVFVGVKNLIRRGRPEEASPWIVTLGFGLLHGFGFASVLGDLGVADAGGVVIPVVAFNAGVELGQLMIAGVALPVLWLLARRSLGPRVAMLGSAGITLAGTYWLIERTLTY